MSVIGVPMLLGPILGPVIGGLIVDNASWRWIFYVNVPVAALGLALAWRLLSADAGRADAGRLDWTRAGAALAGTGRRASSACRRSRLAAGSPTRSPTARSSAACCWSPCSRWHSLRAPRPLIDMRLFRAPGFSAAAATTFLIGGSLFGTMIVLPFYYQLARGQTALTAGLLMAPQGLGAALAMPLAGRLTDRVGGGRVALVGLAVMTLGTLPLVNVGPHTSYGLLAGVLVVRGLGMGGAMMPAMAAAYAVLSGAQVPRATGALNVVQRVGGSMGTALLAVVLQHELTHAVGVAGGGLGALSGAFPARSAAVVASAFGSTFWWSVGASLLALIPAALLAITQRRERAMTPPPPTRGSTWSPSGGFRRDAIVCHAGQRLEAGAGAGAGCWAGAAGRAPRAAPSSGRDVFASSCSSCHSLVGNESSHKQGGDLLGFRMTRADVFSFTRVMPTAAGLSAAQLRAVTDYVFAAQQSAARATRSAR